MSEGGPPPALPDQRHHLKTPGSRMGLSLPRQRQEDEQLGGSSEAPLGMKEPLAGGPNGFTERLG